MTTTTRRRTRRTDRVAYLHRVPGTSVRFREKFLNRSSRAALLSLPRIETNHPQHTALFSGRREKKSEEVHRARRTRARVIISRRRGAARIELRSERDARVSHPPRARCRSTAARKDLERTPCVCGFAKPREIPGHRT